MSSVEKEEKRITRRQFVGGAAVVGAGVLAGKEMVEVPVEVEKIVEVAAGPAAQAGVTLEVYDPSGAIEVTQLHAPRLDTLDGKTICEVMGSWEHDRTAPVIRELLQKQFPTAKIIPYTENPPRSDEEIGKILKEKGCQAVIIGNAG